MAKIKIKNRDQGQPALNPDANWRPKTVLDTFADSRDFLSTLVGGGHTSLANDDLRNQYNQLTSLVGTPMAQKLANQAFLFNQRPDMQRLPMADRVKNFFTLGSNDNDVAQFLKSAGGLGYGAGEGFNNSTLYSNSALQNKNFTQGPPPVENKKIKLIVKK